MEDVKNVENEDVKEEVKEETSVSEESSAEDKQAAEIAEILGGSDENKIPYSRFQKVIEERNSLRDKMSELEETYKAQLEEEITKAKAMNFFNQQEKSQNENPYEFEEVNSGPDPKVSELESVINELRKEIGTIKEEKAQETLTSRVKGLKDSFDFMNETEVLAFAKMYPKHTLEELAKYSHDKNKKFITDKYNTYLEKKKKEADIEISGPEKIKSIKEENKIEDTSSAKQAMKKFLGV